jgi:bifunctional NMN adenylyltransferase/nudix hydrolase
MLMGAIKESRNFDHPQRSLRGRTFTTNFLFRLDDTKPLPHVSGQYVPIGEPGGGVDIETSNAFWMPISEARARTHIWFEDHHAQQDTMLGLIKD